jgi:hypothetical protein
MHIGNEGWKITLIIDPRLGIPHAGALILRVQFDNY